MPLSPGTRLGAFEVVAAIGAGGMGEVYRARDTKLQRDVALKILPDSFADDADRLARFEREATTLASLNHPNIAHVYGIEDSGATRALVMELVDGEDLAQRVARRALRWRTRCRSHDRLPKPSPRLTRPASCTAISSPPTSGSGRTARSKSWTSASPSRRPPPKDATAPTPTWRRRPSRRPP